MTIDAAAIPLEQAYGRFPESRLRRTGISDDQIEALRVQWEGQPLSWRYEQGLAIAAAPDDWVAAEVGTWPPPIEVPVSAYVGPTPPPNPGANWLWWSTATESLARYDATIGQWVAESSTAAGSFVPLSVLAIAGGVATLGSDGKLLSAQIPSLVIGQTFVVASQPEMLALPAHVGDIARRTDFDPPATYMLADPDPAVVDNWLLLTTATTAVTSVNGQTGTVTLGPADVGSDAAGTPRPPTAHAAAHSSGGTDPITPGSIGTDAAGTARPPTAHKANHATGGADALTPTDIGAATRVVHGSTAGTARPTGVTGPVLWFGTVAPTNAAVNDLWFDQTGGLWQLLTATGWAPVATTTLPDAAISVDPTGLVIVQGSDTNVHSVIARLDAAVAARISRVRDATDVDWTSVSGATPVLSYNSTSDRVQGVALPGTLAKQHITTADVAIPGGAAGAQGPVTDITGSGFSLGVTPAGVHQWASIMCVIQQTGGVQPNPGSATLPAVIFRLTETTGGGSTVLANLPVVMAQNSTVAAHNTQLAYVPYYLGAIASTRTFLWQAYVYSPGGLIASGTLLGIQVDTWQR